MSIRPIDMQVAVQRTPDINRSAHMEPRHGEVLQQQFTEKFSKEVRMQDQHVVQSEKSDQTMNESRGYGGGASSQRNKKEAKDKADEKAMLRRMDGGSLFDISV